MQKRLLPIITPKGATWIDSHPMSARVDHRHDRFVDRAARSRASA